MKLLDEWITALAENEKGETIIMSLRDCIDEFAHSGKFNERAEITWQYEPDIAGMPLEEEAMVMEEMQDALQKAMEENKLSILTGVYTGGGARIWVFYTRNVPAFGTILNETLLPFTLLPIEIYTEKDPQWLEYFETRDC